MKVKFSVLLLVVLLVSLMPVAAMASSSTVVEVTQADLGVTWYPADTRSGGSGTFVNGPGTPPLGAGSFQMTTTDQNPDASKAKAQLFNYSYIDTALADIDALSYWAYRSSASTNSLAQTISLNLEVDYVGDGSSFTTLVFEPVYQPGGAGAMMVDAWQQWDAFDAGNAIWWSTKAIPGVPLAFDSYVPWSTIVSNNPNAKIKFGLGFNVGSGWVGQFSGNTDALTIGVSGDSTTYDFNYKPAPRVAKQQVGAALAGLLSTGNNQDDTAIQKAINAIDKSLNPDQWVDDSHLSDKGKKVFDEEKKAVKELQKVTTVNVSGEISALVAVDQALAQTAIDEVDCGGAVKCLQELAKANEEMTKAAAELPGKPDKAIDHYKKAWEHAMKAMDKAVV